MRCLRCVIRCCGFSLEDVLDKVEDGTTAAAAAALSKVKKHKWVLKDHAAKNTSAYQRLERLRLTLQESGTPRSTNNQNSAAGSTLAVSDTAGLDQYTTGAASPDSASGSTRNASTGITPRGGSSSGLNVDRISESVTTRALEPGSYIATTTTPADGASGSATPFQDDTGATTSDASAPVSVRGSQNTTARTKALADRSPGPVSDRSVSTWTTSLADSVSLSVGGGQSTTTSKNATTVVATSDDSAPASVGSNQSATTRATSLIDGVSMSVGDSRGTTTSQNAATRAATSADRSPGPASDRNVSTATTSLPDGVSMSVGDSRGTTTSQNATVRTTSLADSVSLSVGGGQSPTTSLSATTRAATSANSASVFVGITTVSTNSASVSATTSQDTTTDSTSLADSAPNPTDDQSTTATPTAASAPLAIFTSGPIYTEPATSEASTPIERSLGSSGPSTQDESPPKCRNSTIDQFRTVPVNIVLIPETHLLDALPLPYTSLSKTTVDVPKELLKIMDNHLDPGFSYTSWGKDRDSGISCTSLRKGRNSGSSYTSLGEDRGHVQDKPDVETNMELLRAARQKDHDNTLYTPPQAKTSLESSADTGRPLMDMVEEFLRSEHNNARSQGFQVFGADQRVAGLGHEDGVVCSCAYSPDGQSFAVGLDNSNINIYKTSNWERTETLRGHTSAVWSVVYSPTGDRIATASRDMTVILWDAGSGSVLLTLEHANGVRCVAFSPCGNQVASASDDQTVKLWETATGNCVQTIPDHKDGATCVAYSPNRKQVASGCKDNKVRLWDVGGRSSHELSGHTQAVMDVKYSPKGDLLASASEDKTVRLWNAIKRDCKYILRGHENGVLSVAFSPKGDQLASGGRDKAVRVWGTKRGSSIRILNGHVGLVISVAYSPASKQVASGSTDKNVRLWNLDSK